MEVGAPIEKPDLGQIATPVTIVCDMQGLVEVLNEMNQIFQGFLFLKFIRPFVYQCPPEVCDFADDTTF